MQRYSSLDSRRHMAQSAEMDIDQATAKKFVGIEQIEIPGTEMRRVKRHWKIVGISKRAQVLGLCQYPGRVPLAKARTIFQRKPRSSAVQFFARADYLFDKSATNARVDFPRGGHVNNQKWSAGVLGDP